MPEQTCKLTVVTAAGWRAPPYGAQAGDATGPGRVQAAAQRDAALEPLGTLWTLPSGSSQPRQAKKHYWLLEDSRTVQLSQLAQRKLSFFKGWGGLAAGGVGSQAHLSTPTPAKQTPGRLSLRDGELCEARLLTRLSGRHV